MRGTVVFAEEQARDSEKACSQVEMNDDTSKGDTTATANETERVPAGDSVSFLDNFLNRESPIMMHAIDDQGRIVEVNRCWLERMGYPIERVLGRNITEFLTTPSVIRFQSDLTDFRRLDHFTELPREFVTARGEIIEAEVEGRIIKDTNGRMVRAIAAAINVTRRNQREREFQAREDELRKLIDHSPEGIMIHHQGKYVYANHKACEILGAREPSELIGMEALDCIHPSLREQVRERIRNIAGANASSRPTETLFVRLNGDPVNVESSGSPVIFQGKPAIQVVFRDIDDRKRAETIARQNEVQSEVIRAQQEMLLAVSTPLLPLREHVVLMPLVGTMDDARGERATNTLLQGIGEHSARIAILDVTGVPAIGPEMAEGLRETIQAAQLLGAEVVVTGIQPAIARTMIELGLDMTGIVTRGTLRDGIAYAFRRAK